MSVGRLLAPGLAVAALALGAAAPGATAALGTLSLRTLPAVAGARFSLEGRTVTSDAQGRVLLPVSRWADLAGRIRFDGAHLGGGRRARLVRWAGNLRSPDLAKRVRAVLEMSAPVTIRFVDPLGRRVAPGRVTSVRLVSSHGNAVTLRRRDLDRPAWLPVTHVRSFPFGPEPTPRPVAYVVRNAIVDGASVVHRGQQRFVPGSSRVVNVRLLFYTARVKVQDALLGLHVGSDVLLTGPDGRTRRHRLGGDGSLVLEGLPRGDYRVKVDAPGLAPTRSFTLSRDTEISLRVVSDLDLALLMVAGGLLILGLAVARRALRRREPSESEAGGEEVPAS
jgi:hypothetical protein